VLPWAVSRESVHHDSPPESVFNFVQVVGTIHLDDAVDLGRVAHQLFDARVQLLNFGVAGSRA
jgi:hypothetical protein